MEGILVEYHSTRWHELVEQGWITWETVEYSRDGRASIVRMVLCPEDTRRNLGGFR